MGTRLLALALCACGGAGGGGAEVGTAPPGGGAATTPALSLLAGGLGGSGNLDGIGGAARLGLPLAVAVDSRGNAFVADAALHVVRKVAPDGTVSDFAGTRGTAGYTDGIGTAARLDTPAVLAIDSHDNLVVGGGEGHPGILRKITPEGVVSQLPISGGAFALDAAGNILAFDGTVLARRSATGEAAPLAGGGSIWWGPTLDGQGSAARFSQPAAIAVDAQGNVYVADRDLDAYPGCNCQDWEKYGSTVRKVTPQGLVTTLAGRRGEFGQVDGSGAAARFSGIRALALDRDGSLLVADAGGHTLRRVTPAGLVSTVAGRAGQPGRVDGALGVAQFNRPAGLAVSADGSVWIAEAGNFTLRRIDAAGNVTTRAGRAPDPGSTDGRGEQARFNAPQGLAVDADGTVYLADTGNHLVRRIARDGSVSTLAGMAGQRGWVDGQGAAARLNAPTGIALDAQGNLLVADHDNQAIRRIDRNGLVSTLADLRPLDVLTSGGQLYRALPRSLALARDGTLLVADDGRRVIVARSPGGELSTLAGHVQTFLNREGTHDGSGTDATFSGPLGVASGSDGLVYVADIGAVRKLTPDRWVSTFVGGSTGDADGLGIQAMFNRVTGVAVAADGSVLVADRFNRLVRKVTPSATVSPYVGTRGQWGVRLGSERPALGEVMALAIGPQGVVIVSENSVLVAAP